MYMNSGFNFLKESNVRKVYPDDKWVSSNWRVCLSGSAKEFAVVNLSSYLLASAAMFAGEYRMRKLRYTGRNSPDIWASGWSRMGHIPFVSRDFSQEGDGGFVLTGARGWDRRVKNASYFARLYLCPPYISRAPDLSPALISRGIPIYVTPRH